MCDKKQRALQGGQILVLNVWVGKEPCEIGEAGPFDARILKRKLVGEKHRNGDDKGNQRQADEKDKLRRHQQPVADHALALHASHRLA